SEHVWPSWSRHQYRVPGRASAMTPRKYPSGSRSSGCVRASVEGVRAFGVSSMTMASDGEAGAHIRKLTPPAAGSTSAPMGCRRTVAGCAEAVEDTGPAKSKTGADLRSARDALGLRNHRRSRGQNFQHPGCL